ncbi:MAG: hypothetical protein KA419_14980 [Acidobacteria bacterium]|nr:hypothetical protein [Acidobacteriota bacterium]
MKRQCASLLIALTATVCSLLPAAGPDRWDAAEPVLSEVARATLFKNGMVWEARETEVPGPGTYEIRDLPAAVHGTFWLEPVTEGLRVEKVTARESRRKSPQAVRRMAELLQANTGRRVELQVRGEGWIAGTLLPGEAPRPASPGPPSVPAPPRRPALPPRTLAAADGNEASAPTAPEFAVFRTDKGDQACRVEEVTGLRCPAGEIVTTVPGWETGRALRFEVTAGKGKVRVHLLTRGISWAPSYRVETLPGDQARVRCRATVLNDAEDLWGAELLFIAGFPNVRYGASTDPLSSNQTLDAFLASLSAGETGGRRAAPVMAQQMMNAPAFFNEPPETIEPAAGTLREDLFLYPPVRLDLRKGDRGDVPLIDATVPCRDVYLWEMTDAGGDGAAFKSSPDFDGPSGRAEEVWHALRLTNTGKVPWTTAPALTVQGDDLLGQDLLRYTPPGAPTLLRVARSLDVLARREEKEVERQRNAPTEYRGEWDLVTVKGELTVMNGKGKPVAVMVRKRLEGEVIDTAPKASVETPSTGLKEVNPVQMLTWELPVNAGQVVTLSYRYRVRVRR